MVKSIDIDKLIEKLKAEKSPFGNYGEWYDGMYRAIEIIEEYCKEDSNESEESNS